MSFYCDGGETSMASLELDSVGSDLFLFTVTAQQMPRTHPYIYTFLPSERVNDEAAEKHVMKKE